jgi:hypothetical protein
MNVQVQVQVQVHTSVVLCGRSRSGMVFTLIACVLVVVFTTYEMCLICRVITPLDFVLVHWTITFYAGSIIFGIFHLPSQALQSCVAVLI